MTTDNQMNGRDNDVAQSEHPDRTIATVLRLEKEGRRLKQAILVELKVCPIFGVISLIILLVYVLWMRSSGNVGPGSIERYTSTGVFISAMAIELRYAVMTLKLVLFMGAGKHRRRDLLELMKTDRRPRTPRRVAKKKTAGS